MIENPKISIFNRKGRLYLQFFINGKMKQKSTKLPDTKENRKLIQLEVIPKLHKAIINGEYGKKENPIKKFEWYAKKYLYSKEHLKTYWELHNIINNQLLPIFGDIKIDEISRSMIKEWCDKKLQTITPQRVRTLLNHLISIIDIAIDYEHIITNPGKNIKLPEKKTIRKMKPFSKDEVFTLLEHSEGWFKNFLAVAFYTGMRTGEIIALTWNDINFEEKYINVNKRIKKGEIGTPKTKASIRKVPILDDLIPYLKNQIQTSKNINVFINPNTNKRFYDTKHLTPYWKRLLDKVKFEYRVIYNTRHTFATNMLRAGIPILDLAQIMGHSNIEEIMRTYAKYLPEEHLKINRKINPFTDNITDNSNTNTLITKV